jgi:hypothetical protein
MYKFKYKLKNKLDEKIYIFYFELKEIEKGLEKLFDVNKFEIISKNIYTGLNDIFDNEVYQNDKIKIEEYYNKDFSTDNEFDEKNLIFIKKYTSKIKYEEGAFLISDREDEILNIHLNFLFEDMKNSQPFFKYEIMECDKEIIEEFKFKYELKNKLDEKISIFYFELKEIEKGLEKLFDVNKFEIFSKNIYTGLNDIFNNEVYQNDNVEVEIFDKRLMTLEKFRGKIVYEDSTFIVKNNEENIYSLNNETYYCIEVFFKKNFEEFQYGIKKI